MGTDQGEIATETPTAIRQQTSFTSDKFSIESSRPKSLKRTREPTPSSPDGNDRARNPQSGSVSPSKTARLTSHSSRRSPSPRAPNPGSGDAGRWVHDDSAAREVLEKELASTIMVSASIADSQHQAPPASVSGIAPTPASERQAQQKSPAHSPAAPTAVMASSSEQSKAQQSPRSSTGKPRMSGPTQVARSPEEMDVDDQPTRPDYVNTQHHMNTGQPAASIAYPPPPAGGAAVPAPAGASTSSSLPATASVASAAASPSNPPATPSMPQRTVTHPIPGSQDTTPRSPSSSNKKHKCPFCDTEFTRHHNLKSHLLTHSQEKPYECSTCQMRFRRLHDLKRHSKLHTGEKPHICPKCDRKFARGDALARHSKGAGGCAGRRHSLPFDGETSHFDGQSTAEGDEVMTGVQYESSANEVDMSEEDRRRLGMANAYATAAAAHSRTYPPAGARSSGLYPPNTDRSSANTTNNVPSTVGSSHAAIASASLFAQNAMTESPKPLSPHSGASAAAHGSQAPGMQHHSNRRTSDALSLPPSHNTSSQSSKAAGLGGFAPPDGRYGLGNAGAAGGTKSRDPSCLAENGSAVPLEKLWSHILTLESTVKHLSVRIETIEKDHAAEISQMRAELTALRQGQDSGGGLTVAAPSTAVAPTLSRD